MRPRTRNSFLNSTHRVSVSVLSQQGAELVADDWVAVAVLGGHRLPGLERRVLVDLQLGLVSVRLVGRGGCLKEE